MKKVNKVLIIILLVGLLASCSNGNIEIEEENNAIELDSVKSIKLTIGTSGDDLDIYENSHKAGINNWEKYILDSYNVDVEISYISPMNHADLLNGTYLKEAIEKDGLTGLIKLSDIQISNLASLSADGDILALNEYIKNNEYMSSIPEIIMQPFNIQGNIYAIPAGKYYNPSVRLIRKDFLVKTDSSVPTSLAKLQEVLKKIKNQKLGNPLIISQLEPMNSIKDIFYASGCYPSYTGLSSLAYDPLTKGYEDFMLKPEATTAFEYIKYLFENQLAVVSDIEGFDEFKRNSSNGSYYGTLWNYSDDIQEEFETIWYLQGKNDKYLNPIAPVSEVYVLSSKTQNPQEVVDIFVNNFLSNSKGYLNAYFGLENEKYTVQDKKVYEVVGKRNLEFVSLNTDILANEYLFCKENNQMYFENISVLNSITDQMLADNFAFSTTLYPYTYDVSKAEPTWLQSPGDVYSIDFDIFIRKRGDLDVQTMLDEYKVTAAKFNMQKTLDSINELFGSTAAYGYID